MKTQAIVTNIPLNINIKIANTSDRFGLLSNLAWKLNTLDLTKSTVSKLQVFTTNISTC